MKYKKTKTWFLIDGKKFKPFNGESIGHISWSHGITHMKTEDNLVNFCGIDWFEKNAGQNCSR